MHEKPFPFSYAICSEQENLTEYVTRTLKSYKGIMYYNNIGTSVGKNYRWFSNGGWDKFEGLINPLIKQRKQIPALEDQKIERKACEELRSYLQGIGTKQARNYLQLLGLTRYEVPIDSRFLSWFNELGIPITLNPKALSYAPTYNAVLDKIQELCVKADVLPCILDACVYGRKDEEWPKCFDT